MKKYLSHSKISNENLKLFGDWVLDIQNNRRWRISISRVKSSPEEESNEWTIKNHNNHVLAVISANNLCEWLNLQQLLVLNSMVAMRAAAIKVVHHEIAKIIGIERDNAVNITCSPAHAIGVDFFNIVIIEQGSKNEQYHEKILKLKVRKEAIIRLSAEHKLQRHIAGTEEGGSSIGLLGIDVQVEIARTSIKAQDITCLRLGALLFLPHDQNNKFNVTIQYEEYSLCANYDIESSNWIITNVNISTASMTQAELAHPLPSMHSTRNDAISLEDISICLSVQFPKATMRLTDMIHIASGTIVSLDIPKDSEVNVLCNDVIIATGVLIELDDRLAVEITSTK